MAESGAAFLYLYRWNRCGRKGQRCRVFARGTMNSVGLEFEDGEMFGVKWNKDSVRVYPQSATPPTPEARHDL